MAWFQVIVPVFGIEAEGRDVQKREEIAKARKEGAREAGETRTSREDER